MTATGEVTRLAIETHRGRFSALAAGDTSRPLVLVLHGFPDAPATFVPLLRALDAHGYRAIAPWMRGYAPSPIEGPFDVEMLADDVDAWLAALSPGAPAFVLGHDWGAVAAYAASVRHPLRIAAAVALSVPHPMAFLHALDLGQLACSWYMLFFQLPGAAGLCRARDFRLIDELWQRWSPGYELPAARRGEVHACLAASWPAPLLYYRALVRPPRAALARIGRLSPARELVRVPTLYLHGANDGCIGPEIGRNAARHFAGRYRRDVLADAGHFLAAERPEEIAARAAAWFTAARG